MINTQHFRLSYLQPRHLLDQKEVSFQDQCRYAPKNVFIL